MDHAVYTANKMIMTSYPYTVKWKVSHTLPYMVTWKVKSHTLPYNYGHVKGKSHTLPYMVTWKVKVTPYHIWLCERWKSHLTIYGHMKGESYTLPYMVTWKVKVTPYHIWSYERWKLHLTIYGLLQVYLLCWVSWTLYLSIMDLSVMTSWLHLRSSSSVEEQEVWGV